MGADPMMQQIKDNINIGDMYYSSYLDFHVVVIKPSDDYKDEFDCFCIEEKVMINYTSSEIYHYFKKVA